MVKFQQRMKTRELAFDFSAQRFVVASRRWRLGYVARKRSVVDYAIRR